MLIQVCPALMDWTVFLVMFAVLYGAGAHGFSDAQCAWVGGIGQLAYMVSSLLAGLALSRRNARAILLTSTVGATVMGIVCLRLIPFFVPQMLCQVLLFIFMAMFFNSFQTFMRGETLPGGLARTVGRYTLAWSAGSAGGFLSSGSLYELGNLALCGMALLVGVVILTTLVRHRPRPHAMASADEHVEDAAPGAQGVNVRYVLIGWCLIFTAIFVQRPLQNLWPAMCARAEVHPFLPGLILSLHMLVQGVSGYGVAFFGRWRYRRSPLVVLHLVGVFLFALLWLTPQFVVSAAAIVLLGLYSGFAYFSAVYYSSNSGRRSFNIGVNECLVGMGAFAGLFAAQQGEAWLGADHGMYVVCAVALVVSMLIQLALGSSRSRGDRVG